MTVREHLHRLVDELPEEDLTELLSYVADLHDNEPLSAKTQAALQEGLNDFRDGRSVSLAEYRTMRGL